MEKWKLTITKIDNGYILNGNEDQSWVFEDDDKDELKAHESMLWRVIEYFGFYGSKHDTERLRVIRQKNK